MGNVVTGYGRAARHDPEPAVSIHLSPVSRKYLPRIQPDVSSHLLPKWWSTKYLDQSYLSPYHLHARSIATNTEIPKEQVTCINHKVPRHVIGLSMGRDSSVGTATLYGLYGPGIESRREARFSAPVQTGPGAHPASCIMGTGSFLGGKAAGAWCWQSNSI